jgi:hypothetical protein
MDHFLITEIPSYSSCYIQYLPVYYPWLGQHVAGLKHNTFYIR